MYKPGNMIADPAASETNFFLEINAAPQLA
jgi:hypothetical protein